MLDFKWRHFEKTIILMAVAAIDRLVHHATVINIGGESYRMKNKKGINQE